MNTFPKGWRMVSLSRPTKTGECTLSGQIGGGYTAYFWVKDATDENPGPSNHTAYPESLEKALEWAEANVDRFGGWR